MSEINNNGFFEVLSTPVHHRWVREGELLQDGDEYYDWHGVDWCKISKSNVGKPSLFSRTYRRPCTLYETVRYKYELAEDRPSLTKPQVKAQRRAIARAEDITREQDDGR